MPDYSAGGHGNRSDDGTVCPRSKVFGGNDLCVKSITHKRCQVFCFDLALTFYEEANLALQAGAWFAATPIASSALEAVLLSKCFFQEADVKALLKFQSLKRSHKGDFGLFARSLDLGKLLEIANELSWFPDGGVPKVLTSHLAGYLDEGTISALLAFFDGYKNVGHICAHHVREYRNLLHPAVCPRTGRQPSKDVGLTAAFLFMVAFTSVAGAF